MKKLKLLSLVLLPSVILTTVTIPTFNPEIVKAELPSKKEGVIVPITDRLNAAAKDFYKKMQEGETFDNYTAVNLNSTKQNEKFDVSGSTLGEPIKGDIEPVYMGDNILDNTGSDVDQNLSTSEFSQAVAFSTSTATSKGFKINSDKIVPVFIPGSDINLEFNASSTETKTFTETNTVTAPRQLVKVPAGKKYKVRADLRKVPYYGKVALKAVTTKNNPNFTNTLQGVHYDSHGIPTQKDIVITSPYVMDYFITPSNFKDLKVETNATSLMDAFLKYLQGNLESKIAFDGEGEYSYQTGTDFIVTVTDITDSKNVKVVDKKIVKLK
ncbi:ETX/MTX2 family pore-forming toxin [Listeria sp. PSOL-1]|uniref:ETX/MTX2 family pore-forming toxin n=1 Tax=Listeria sp. PSOL-1 TaxID=1844999 RepID=UPI0013D25018|nr:ETX/MTX2 family pore-forming toxin [Listeria sp. PSOL-1]